jgi:hypothetical protein
MNEKPMIWKRYRFLTKSHEDYRPLVSNPKYPWWCTGYCMEGKQGSMVVSAAVIVAYLPPEEDLKKYWDDAFDIDVQDREEITFTSRFPKPEYFVES